MSTLLQPDARRAAPRDPLAAVLLAGPALLTLALVLHHPVLPPGPRGGAGGAGTAAGVAAVGPALRAVHGTLFVLLAAQVLGFSRFSARLGWSRLPVAAGFLAYAAGAMLSSVAVLLDGFVAPELAAACLRAAQRAAGGVAPGCGPADGGAFRLISVVIQVFTKAGLIATSVAIAAWALALLARPAGAPLLRPAPRPDALDRGVGAIGLACAAAPSVALLGSTMWLRPGNLAALVTAQVVWSVLAAAVMVRGAAAPRTPPDAPVRA